MLGRFNPGMFDGITCSNLLETNIWKKLIKLADFPAHNLPTYCVYGTFLYNFNHTDPKLFQQGFLNLERFPCRKTCGFCGVCPEGFPREQTFPNGSKHGNVCRKMNDNNYRCPRGCRKTKNGKAPFCSTMGSSSRPCRN